MPFYLSRHTVLVDSRGRRVPTYLSRPTIGDKRPVVIVVHELWGLNDSIRATADRYANLGYVAVAPDLFAEAKPKERKEAMKLAGSVSPELSFQILRSVYDYIAIREFASSKVGLHGYGFGASCALNFACDMKKIAAASIFYASALPNKEKLENLTAPLLLVYGDKDETIKVEQVRSLETTLSQLDKKVQVEIYPGARNSFSNETGQNYNESAAKDAWEKTISFFGTYMPLPKA